MTSTLSRAIEMFADPKTIGPFLLGSIALGVVSNAIYQILCNILGITTAAAVEIAVGAFIILIVAVVWVSYYLQSKSGLVHEPTYATPNSRRGLIYLVSSKQPCITAAGYHAETLEWLWLLCSTQTAMLAEEIKNEIASTIPRLQSKGRIKICTIEDADDPLEFFNRIKSIFNDLPEGLQRKEVIADYLGMTSNASVGVALACMLHGWPLEYTQPQFDERRRPIAALPPREIAFQIQRNSK